MFATKGFLFAVLIVGVVLVANVRCAQEQVRIFSVIQCIRFFFLNGVFFVFGELNLGCTWKSSNPSSSSIALNPTNPRRSRSKLNSRRRCFQECGKNIYFNIKLSAVYLLNQPDYYRYLPIDTGKQFKQKYSGCWCLIRQHPTSFTFSPRNSRMNRFQLIGPIFKRFNLNWILNGYLFYFHFAGSRYGTTNDSFQTWSARNWQPSH